MRALLDTHIFLWWIFDDPQLDQSIREVLKNAENDLFLSAASTWEIAIKVQIGKLVLPGDLLSFISRHMALNSIVELPITVRHALHTILLPSYHKDPFDRLIVAQSQLEVMPVITTDPEIRQYGVDVVT
jgi:PIN domain nuclease of toxin-antitoxin system